MNLRFNPLYSLLRTITFFLFGRIHFPKTNTNKVLTMEDDQKFTIFRHVIVDTRKTYEKNLKVIFRVRFQLAGMSPRKNKIFSIIPIPFFVGLPGFRSKYWTLNENNNVFQGIYEWDSEMNARTYSNSFAMRFMKRRSISGSASFEIITGKTLEEYIHSFMNRVKP